MVSDEKIQDLQRLRGSRKGFYDSDLEVDDIHNYIHGKNSNIQTDNEFFKELYGVQIKDEANMRPSDFNQDNWVLEEKYSIPETKYEEEVLKKISFNEIKDGLELVYHNSMEYKSIKIYYEDGQNYITEDLDEISEEDISNEEFLSELSSDGQKLTLKHAANQIISVYGVIEDDTEELITFYETDRNLISSGVEVEKTEDYQGISNVSFNKYSDGLDLIYHNSGEYDYIRIYYEEIEKGDSLDSFEEEDFTDKTNLKTLSNEGQKLTLRHADNLIFSVYGIIENEERLEDGETTITEDKELISLYETDRSYMYNTSDVIEISNTEESHKYLNTQTEFKTKYLVYVYIYRNVKTGQMFYVLDEPTLYESESKQLNSILTNIKSDIVSVDSDEIKESLKYENMIDKKSEKVEELFMKDVNIKYGLPNKLASLLDSIESALRGFNVSTDYIQSLQQKIPDMSEDTKRKLLYYIKREIVYYGDITPLIQDTRIEDVSGNGHNLPVTVNHESYGELVTLKAFSKTEMDNRVNKLATETGGEVSKDSPTESGSLADGSRVQLTKSEEVTDLGGNFTIRKFQDIPFSPVDLYSYNSISSEQLSTLWIVLTNDGSVLTIGGTAAGKTTFTNAMTMFLIPDNKIVTIEDTREINLVESNKLNMVTRETQNSSIGMSKLVKDSLRMRPTTIVVGEVRGEEAQDMAEAANTGHQVLSTFHAENVDEAKTRLTSDKLNIDRSSVPALNFVVTMGGKGLGGNKQRVAVGINQLIGVDDEGKIQYDRIGWYDNETGFNMKDLHNIEYMQNYIFNVVGEEFIYNQFQEQKVVIEYLDALLPDRNEIEAQVSNFDLRIKDDVTNETIEDATVIINNESHSTTDGIISFEGLKTGEYDIIIKPDNEYHHTKSTITVSETDKEKELTVTPVAEDEDKNLISTTVSSITDTLSQYPVEKRYDKNNNEEQRYNKLQQKFNFEETVIRNYTNQKYSNNSETPEIINQMKNKNLLNYVDVDLSAFDTLDEQELMKEFDAEKRLQI